MIPIRLQLKNFMSYGEGVPPLDFTGIRLACLSGDNGNGKTALLDAITWALFGKTRAPAEEDVIRLGASQAHVLFDFTVEDVKYRVHKARSKKAGTAGSIWELQIWQEDGTLRSLSGSSARETQENIRQLLRMDYETFVKTGYLAQGSADEFARVKESERRKVLANILDLSRYERLEELAKEKHKDAALSEQDAEREIKAIDAELEYEDGYHLAREAARQRLEVMNAEVVVLQAEREKLAAEIDRMEAQEQKARDWEERIRDVQDEIAANLRALADVEARIASADSYASQRETIMDAYYRYGALTERIKPLEEQYDKLVKLGEEARQLERVIQKAYEVLDRERYKEECEVKTLEQEAREVSRYEDAVVSLNAEIAAFGKPEERRQAAEAKRQETNDALISLKAEHAALKTQDTALQKRLQALSGSDAADCEFCGQPLPLDRRQEAIAQTEAEIKTLAALMTEVAAKGRDAKKEADRLHAEAEEAQRAQHQVNTLEARLAQAEQERLRISERVKTLPDVRRRFEKYVKQITDRDYAPTEQERLMQVSAQMEKHERVSQQLADARNELARYSDAERNKLLLEQAEVVMLAEPPRAEELRGIIAKREAQVEKARKQIIDIRVRTASLPTLQRERDDVAVRLKDAGDAAGRAEREIGDLTGRLDRCATQKDHRARRAEERLTAAREKEQYKELVAAFGKKGVQALIIENALPEIEEQANALLSKMTDGGMQLQLVTQKEAKTKSVGTIETLDIIISDEMGRRPYEMFSGGEAFRINLAIRVALSKMLSRRAGAPLQTLILDEGFGTQDPRGREAITDALTAIADDFALVLVITHIEELKEAFPNRIEVVKGPSGSTFTVA